MSETLSKNLQKLDAFLMSEAVDDEAMLLTTLDGFLTGLVVCPEMIMPSEWMPLVWGGEEPVFDTGKQAETIIGLIMGHYNDIIRDLDRGQCRPIYDTDFDGSLLWEVWIDGFWQALTLRPEAMSVFDLNEDRDLQAALFALTRLHQIATTPSAKLEPMDIDAELAEQAADYIPHAVQTLHRMRKRMQENPFAPPANENTPKTGRNDPCPCGSGKKFKKCCLN
jgi:uncharacterized protein